MERVVAVSLADETVAYPFSSLEKKRVVNDAIAGQPVVVFWAPGTASALDKGRIARGRDVGSSGVYHRRLGSRVLTFEPAGDGLFRDRQTKSTWDIFGHAVAGPLAGSKLDPVQHGNHFWFAWVVFMPETRIIR